jgi:hypothetical protein
MMLTQHRCPDVSIQGAGGGHRVKVERTIMNKYFYRTILSVIALIMFGAVTAPAQTSKQGQEQTHRDLKIDMPGMMNEPHHVLAMAHRQNIGTFAKALRDQAQLGTPLSADFARAAVAEMNRSFDQAEEHDREHVKTMSADMRSRMAAMIKEMDLLRSKLKVAITALEKDVQDYTLNPKKITTDSAEIIRYLDEISKMHNGN